MIRNESGLSPSSAAARSACCSRCFLIIYGVKSVIFNTEERTRLLPKGSSYNARTIEHCRRLGIATVIRKLGLPPDHPKDAAYFT